MNPLIIAIGGGLLLAYFLGKKDPAGGAKAEPAPADDREGGDVDASVDLTQAGLKLVPPDEKPDSEKQSLSPEALSFGEQEGGEPTIGAIEGVFINQAGGIIATCGEGADGTVRCDEPGLDQDIERAGQKGLLGGARF